MAISFDKLEMRKARFITALIILLIVASGCFRAPHDPTNPSTDKPIVIKLRNNSPVMPQCKLMPLPDYIQSRRFFMFDLNDDGTPESFVENYSGANTMSFALVDSLGNLLISADDMTDLGGHQILILNHQNSGYRDMISSSFYPGEITTAYWKFNGTRYVRSKYFYTKPEVWRDRSLIPGDGAAVWNAITNPMPITER